MRLRSAPGFVALAALAAVPLAARAAGPLTPVEAFVEEAEFSQPRLSPDGNHIAVNVRMKRGDRKIPTMTIYSLPELKPVSVIALPGYEIPVNFTWVTNRRLIVLKGLEIGLRERPIATGEVVAVDLDGTHQEYLYGYKGFRQSRRGDRYGDDYGWANVVHIPQSRDGSIYLGTHNWDGSHSMLYEVNTMSANRKLLADIAMKDMGFLFQNDATPRFAYGEDDDNKPVLYRRDDASGEWRIVDRQRLGAVYHPFAFTPDDSAMYVTHSPDGGPSMIVREDMKSGARQVIAKDPVGSIDTIEYTSHPHLPIAFASSTGVPKAHYLDESLPDAVLHKTLSGLFPDNYVSFINFTDDGQKLLFGVSSDRDPGSYYLYDKKTSKADLLFSNMQAIEPEHMAPRQPVTFAARDGLTVTGYLTMPGNPSKTRLPLVLLPHGGPFGVNDSWYFDEDAQFLASRGYAVLQVNFRGSSSRGLAFKEAGYREWGGKIMNDLIDGVKWATARPDIDAGRVCVFGISFGAYAALMLPVREPAMFKCSVGYSGRYELSSKFDEEGIKGEKRSTNYLIKTLGDDPAKLAADSPTRLADQIKVPVLLVHGNKDKTTNLGQAEAMRDALTKAGRPPEWMLVKNEGHGFYDSEHRKEFYLRLEGFLARHIGPK